MSLFNTDPHINSLTGCISLSSEAVETACGRSRCRLHGIRVGGCGKLHAFT